MERAILNPHGWREARRQRGLELHAQGWRPGEIAEALGVSRRSARAWTQRTGGQSAETWRTRPRTGRPPKLTSDQFNLIPDLLSHGAEAYGFRGEVWTCSRVARVIEQEYGVSYHPHHVARMLKALRWTPQRPIIRAAQRDEVAIERWRSEVWPELYKRAEKEGRTIVFVDESGFYLLPSVVRTYAPLGQGAVLRSTQTRDHLSAMCGATPEGNIYTIVREEALTSDDAVLFLMHLFEHVPNRLLVIWDGSPIHRGEVQELLRQGAARHIHLEALPAYAPDLNPVECMWHYLKSVELGNVCCHSASELRFELALAIRRLRNNPRVVRSFFDEVGLR